MPLNESNVIEYLVLIISEFAIRNRISEVDAYICLTYFDALSPCERHYGIMHTLSVEENVDSLTEYRRRKGGKL